MEDGATSRLTPMESLMWRLEGDRRLSSTFGSVTFLDRAPDPDVLRQRLAVALDSIPRFRRRVEASGSPIAGATWIEVEPDLDHHLRWVDVSQLDAGQLNATQLVASEDGHAGEESVLAFAAELVATPFESDRPPWNFVVVTGLPEGRSALVQRVHHAVTDGEGGIGLAAHFVDVEPNPDPPTSTSPGRAAPAATESATWLERLASTTTERATDLARAATGAARWTAGGVGDPSRFARLGTEAWETAQSLRRQLLVIDRARSPLWTSHSTERQVVVGSVPFAPVRAAATAAGVSINDVFITATLRGVAAYHRIQGADVAELRVAMPVSTRPDRDRRGGTEAEGGNAFSPTRITLPSGEAHTAAAHLKVVSNHLARTKTERATNLIESLAAVAELVPDPLLRATVARQAATIDFAASNVRTTSVPLYIGGAQMEATYALGPLMGTAANITMLSYNGRLDLGIHVDPLAVTEPALLRDTVVAAFHEVATAIPVG